MVRVLGAALLTGILAAWVAQPAEASTVLYSEDFSYATPAGTVEEAYGDVWTLDSSESGGRYAEQNLSVKNGSLRVALKGVDVGGDGVTGGYVVFAQPGGGYGPGTRFDYDFQVLGNGHGWGVNFLLWPNDDQWREGEIDFVEGNLDQHMHLFQHSTRCRVGDGYCPNLVSVDTEKGWGHGRHKVRIDWYPDRMVYRLDGERIKTVREEVPTTLHRPTLQVSQSRDTPHGSTELRVYRYRVTKLDVAGT